MKTSILAATLFGLSTLPVVCVAQDGPEAAPVDPAEEIIQLDRTLPVWQMFMARKMLASFILMRILMPGTTSTDI
jgi:hypothetical protein